MNFWTHFLPIFIIFIIFLNFQYKTIDEEYFLKLPLFLVFSISIFMFFMSSLYHLFSAHSENTYKML